MFNIIKDMHRRFEIPAGDEGLLPEEQRKLSLEALKEEVQEYANALEQKDSAEQLDALLDLVYFAYGRMYLSGFTKEMVTRATALIHYANMSKQRASCDEDSKRGSKFDLIKPEGWKAPDIVSVVTDSTAKPQLVVLEGPDGVGKSTVARELADLVDGVVLHAGAPPIMRRSTQIIAELHNEILDNAQSLLDQGKWVILDRLWPSELIYGAPRRKEVGDVFCDSAMVRATKMQASYAIFQDPGVIEAMEFQFDNLDEINLGYLNLTSNYSFLPMIKIFEAKNVHPLETAYKIFQYACKPHHEKLNN